MANRDIEILVVDDDDGVRNAVRRLLIQAGLKVESVARAEDALGLLHQGRRYDAIVSDLMMPGIDGMQLLRQVRQMDLDVPLVIMTGNPSLETAIQTLEYGGYKYLPKPVAGERLVSVVKDAAAHHRLSLLKRKALEICEAGGWLLEELDELEARFTRALDHVWVAFQPIVHFPTRHLYGYEALVRCADPELATPGMLFDAAERLGRVQELGVRIRDAVARAVPDAPEHALIFANLHALDLTCDSLFAPESPLSHRASRVVLEITERSALHRIEDLRERMDRLRALGFRIAVDDLGAGYAGLSSFSQLEPDIVKLDMSLVRGIDRSSSKASLVRSMIAVCTRELGVRVVCEGVETAAERDTLLALGADLLQGFLFARPEPTFRGESVFPDG